MQIEIELKHGEATNAADNFLVFKLLVKAISARNGVYATFYPYPIEGAPANWLNLDFRTTAPTDAAQKAFVDGIKARLGELSVFLNPTAETCGESGVVTVKEGADGTLKIKGIDPTCNPYIALTLLIGAGVEGVKGYTKKPTIDEFLKSYLPEKMLKGYLERVKELKSGFDNAEDKKAYVVKTYFEKA